MAKNIKNNMSKKPCQSSPSCCFLFSIYLIGEKSQEINRNVNCPPPPTNTICPKKLFFKETCQKKNYSSKNNITTLLALLSSVFFLFFLIVLTQFLQKKLKEMIDATKKRKGGGEGAYLATHPFSPRIQIQSVGNCNTCSANI